MRFKIEYLIYVSAEKIEWRERIVEGIDINEIIDNLVRGGKRIISLIIKKIDE